MEALRGSLEKQVDELELLQSMFSAPGEFQIDDQTSFEHVSHFLNGLSPGIPGRLSYSLHILINAHHSEDDSGTPKGPGDQERPTPPPDLESSCTVSGTQPRQHTVDVSVKLPHGYPETFLPEVYVRSNGLTRQGQDDLNTDLQDYMKGSIPHGEVCVLSIVEWIRDNTSSYLPVTNTPDSRDSVPPTSGGTFCRMWLYMHHIYNKTKRRDILYYAHELGLTGFCLPGKPGVVCVEGEERQTKEFYDTLRRWNWKSITCRKRELTCDVGDIDAHRKVAGFQELFFDIHGTRQNHVDMGQFLEYLRAHQMEYMFKELFGVDGHGSGASASGGTVS